MHVGEEVGVVRWRRDLFRLVSRFKQRAFNKVGQVCDKRDEFATTRAKRTTAN